MKTENPSIRGNNNNKKKVPRYVQLLERFRAAGSIRIGTIQSCQCTTRYVAHKLLFVFCFFPFPLDCIAVCV